MVPFRSTVAEPSSPDTASRRLCRLAAAAGPGTGVGSPRLLGPLGTLSAREAASDGWQRPQQGVGEPSVGVVPLALDREPRGRRQRADLLVRVLIGVLRVDRLASGERHL